MTNTPIMTADATTTGTPSGTTHADAPNPPLPPSSPSATPRRWRDAAVLLPLLGTALLMPPLVGLTLPVDPIVGVPAIVLYVFGVWACLILGTARITAGLCQDRRDAAEAEGRDDGIAGRRTEP